MNQPHLDRTASRSDVLRWLDADVLTEEEARRALDVLGPETPGSGSGLRSAWRFVARRAVWVGFLLLATALVFFIASQWGQMTLMERLMLTLGVTVAATVAAVALRVDSVAGQAAAALAALSFGPVMAVYGQAFQTGESWDLFARWALVAAVYAWAARSALCRVLAVFLGWLTLILFWPSLPFASRHLFEYEAWFGGLALAAAAAALAAGFVRLRVDRWSVRVPLALALGTVVTQALSALLGADFSAGERLQPHLAVALGVAATAALLWVFRRPPGDPVLVTLGLAAGAVLLSCAWGRILFDGLGDPAALLLLGVEVCAVTGLAAWWFRRWHADLDEDEAGEETGEEAGEETGDEAGEETGEAGPTRRDLLRDLVSAQHDTEAAASAALKTPPWYLHLVAGLGSFVGAVIAGSFFLALELSGVWLNFGLSVGFFFAAGWIARNLRAPILGEQLLWLFVGASQLLFVHAWTGAYSWDETLLLWLCPVQIAVIAWVPRRALRTAAAVLLAVFSTTWWLLEFDRTLDVPALLFTSLAVAMLLVPASLRTSSRLWRPVAFGLALAELLFVVALALFGILTGSTERIGFHWPLLSSGVVALLGLWVLRDMKRELGAPAPRVATAVVVGFLAVAAAAHSHPALLIALVYLLLSHLRSDRRLEVLALAAFVAVLLRAYYDLSYPLAVRAGWLAGTATLVLALAWWMSRTDPEGAGSGRAEDPKPPGDARDERRAVALVAALALALSIPAFAVWHKERQLDESQVVRLELRPVDPRSWMMGDYMRLAFQVQRDIRDALEQVPPERRGDLEGLEGHAVLRVDEQNVARFERLWRGEELGAGEVLLHWQRDPGSNLRIDLGMDSFFFPEGQGGRYARSQWAKVALAPDGEAILVGVEPVD